MAKPINNKYTEADISEALHDIGKLASTRKGKPFDALLHALVISSLNGELTLQMIYGEEKANEMMKAIYADGMKDREVRKRLAKESGVADLAAAAKRMIDKKNEDEALR